MTGLFHIKIDESLVKYCFGYENNITMDDLGLLNPIMYNLALEISNSSENVDLGLINGFNEWAENNDIQVNKITFFFDFLKSFYLFFPIILLAFSVFYFFY